MNWLPVFDYGSDPLALAHLALTLPPSRIDWSSSAVGGADVAASGVGEAFEIRRDRVARLRLRFWESEYAAVEAWFAWAQGTMQPFDLTFDAGDPATKRTVRLFSPVLGEGDFAPERSDLPLVLELEVAVCTTDGAAFGLSWTGG